MPIIDPGYRLPSGDLTNDDLNCMILFYPDRDEYRRALWGALDYLGTWKAWERDTLKRGKDAAAIWKEANECTWECFTMGCLDQLTDDVAAIKSILLGMDPCCDGTTTINPGPGISTEIEPGVGDPPDYYGETAITDWDDWTEHVCYNAHRWVDQLVNTAESYNAAAQNGILTLGLVAAGLALMSFTGIGIPVAISIAVAVLSATAAGGALIFSTTAQDIEDARDDIVCALINGGDVSAVVEAALGSASLDWTSTFYAIDYDSATAIIYEGGANGEYLPTETRTDCDCTEPTLFTISFASTVESWTQFDCNMIWESDFGGSLRAIPGATSTWRWVASPSGNALVTQYSLGTGNLYIEKVEIDWELVHTGTPGFNDVKFAIIEQGDTEHVVMEGDTTSDFTWNTPYTHSLTPASAIQARTAQPCLVFNVYRNAYTAVQKVSIKEVRVWGYVS